MNIIGPGCGTPDIDSVVRGPHALRQRFCGILRWSPGETRRRTTNGREYPTARPGERWVLVRRL